jgi:hypothetical protein
VLAHTDFLDAAIIDVDATLTKAAAPFPATPKRVRAIPGISHRTAIMLLAECGADMSVSASPLTWLAGPVSAEVTTPPAARTDQETRHGSVALRTALTGAAHAAARTKNTYLAAHHAHIRGRRGLPKARRHPPPPTHRLLACRLPTTPSSAQTGHNVAAPPNTAPDASSTNSNNSATPSPCNPHRKITALRPETARLVT